MYECVLPQSFACCKLLKNCFEGTFFRHMECWSMSQILEAPVTAFIFETLILTIVYKSYQKIESLTCQDGIFRGSNFGLSFWYVSGTRFVHWAKEPFWLKHWKLYDSKCCFAKKLWCKYYTTAKAVQSLQKP